MKKTAIILGVIVLIAGGCKNQPKSKAGQTNNVSEIYFDNVKIQDIKYEINELEMDTTYWVKFKYNYNFETFKTKVFRGKLAHPDFTGNEFAEDKEYVDFITEECKDEGINFGGHYTIISRSCGCMCQHIFVIDRILGKIFTDINLNGDGKWGYVYKPDSKLLIANSGLFITDSLDYYTAFWGNTPELYVWTGEKFKRIQ